MPPSKNKPLGIRVIFFDIGGVLLTNAWDHEIRQRAALHFSLDAKELEVKHAQCFERLERGELSLHDYLTKTIFYKKRNFSEENFIRFMKAQSKPKTANLEVLKKLAQGSKYFLAALNNESVELNDFRIRKFGLNEYLSIFLSSCFLGARKPEPKIFEIALRTNQRRPEEYLFIDDRKENLLAAKAFGFKTIHLLPTTNLGVELRKFGVRI